MLHDIVRPAKKADAEESAIGDRKVQADAEESAIGDRKVPRLCENPHVDNLFQ
jgi:hypothetical protein